MTFKCISCNIIGFEFWWFTLLLWGIVYMEEIAVCYWLRVEEHAAGVVFCVGFVLLLVAFAL